MEAVLERGGSCEIQFFNPGGGLQKTMFLSVGLQKTMFLSVNDVSFSQTSKNDVSFSQRCFFQSDFKKRCFLQSTMFLSVRTSKNDVSFSQRCFFQSPPWIEKLDFAASAWADSFECCALQLCSHWCLHPALSDHSSPEAQDDRNSARSTSARSAIIMIVAMGQS